MNKPKSKPHTAEKTRTCPVLSDEDKRVFSRIELYQRTTVKALLAETESPKPTKP